MFCGSCAAARPTLTPAPLKLHPAVLQPEGRSRGAYARRPRAAFSAPQQMLSTGADELDLPPRCPSGGLRWWPHTAPRPTPLGFQGPPEPRPPYPRPPRAGAGSLRWTIVTRVPRRVKRPEPFSQPMGPPPIMVREAGSRSQGKQILIGQKVHIREPVNGRHGRRRARGQNPGPGGQSLAKALHSVFVRKSAPPPNSTFTPRPQKPLLRIVLLYFSNDLVDARALTPAMSHGRGDPPVAGP